MIREFEKKPIGRYLIDRNDGGSQIGIEYNSDLFDASSIIGFAGHYRELVRKLTAAPDAALDSVDMLTAAERHDLIRVGSGPSRPVRDTTIVAGFEAQVRRAPQATALICSGSEMTYGELNQAANRLAVLLREHGAKPGTTVGICQPRRADLVVSMLAVLKTGAAYLPLDPAHPAARVAMIAADAGAVLILAGAADAISSADVDAPVLVLPELADQLAALPGDDAPSPASSRDDAYVIYTSGSTGQPKGVAIEHGEVGAQARSEIAGALLGVSESCGIYRVHRQRFVRRQPFDFPMMVDRGLHPGQWIQFADRRIGAAAQRRARAPNACKGVHRSRSFDT